MKEYKIIKKSIWSKDIDFEDTLNQFAREGWAINSVTHHGGNFSKVLLERDKYR